MPTPMPQDLQGKLFLYFHRVGQLLQLQSEILFESGLPDEDKAKIQAALKESYSHCQKFAIGQPFEAEFDILSEDEICTISIKVNRQFRDSIVPGLPDE